MSEDVAAYGGQGREPPLEINQRIHLDRKYYAHFDGELVVVEIRLGENWYVPAMRISPLAMAHLLWLNKRIVECFPAQQWCINLAEVTDDNDVVLR